MRSQLPRFLVMYVRPVFENNSVTWSWSQQLKQDIMIKFSAGLPKDLLASKTWHIWDVYLNSVFRICNYADYNLTLFIAIKSFCDLLS